MHPDTVEPRISQLTARHLVKNGGQLNHARYGTVNIGMLRDPQKNVLFAGYLQPSWQAVVDQVNIDERTQHPIISYTEPLPLNVIRRHPVPFAIIGPALAVPLDYTSAVPRHPTDAHLRPFASRALQRHQRCLQFGKLCVG